MTPEEQIAQYERDIAASGLPLPDDYKCDPADMQIAKLDDRLRPLVAKLPWADASTGEYRYYEADVGFGGALYYVADHEDSTWSWGTSFTTEKGYAGCQAKGLTFDSAKAAAQADYNRRIRAALRTDKEGKSDD
jgi:hypothetical protein